MTYGTVAIPGNNPYGVGQSADNLLTTWINLRDYTRTSFIKLMI